MAEKQTYAIIESGSKQFLVQEGEKVRLPFLKEKKKGEALSIKEVLFTRSGDDIKVGKPYIDGAVVDCTILGDGKAKKVISFKFKRRKNERIKKGHRQQYTEIEIKKIKA